MTPVSLSIGERERARKIASELLRCRAKGYPALDLLMRLGKVMRRGDRNRFLSTEVVMDFARALVAEETADKGTAQ